MTGVQTCALPISGAQAFSSFDTYLAPFVKVDNLHYEKFQDGSVKCIEDEIPFELPEGWAWCRLNSIVDVRDGTHDTPTYVDKGIPLITSKNLVEGGIDYSNVKYISEKDAISINDRSGVNIGVLLSVRQ